MLPTAPPICRVHVQYGKATTAPLRFLDAAYEALSASLIKLAERSVNFFSLGHPHQESITVTVVARRKV